MLEHGRWPNLFVVGASKAGTTSLWRYLGQHPEIFMSPKKEPGFFSSAKALSSANARRAYLELFAEAGNRHLRGEASPSYLTRRRAAGAIHEVSPHAKIVVSLREPIARTHSAYLSLVADGVERRSFSQAVQDDLAGRRLEGAPTYVKPDLYSRSIKRYRRLFGPQVFVLFAEELSAQPDVVMRQLYAFLGVDPAVADALRPKRHNQFRAPRNRAVGRLMSARRLARPLVPERFRDTVAAAATKPTGKPKPEPEAVELLRRAYRPDVASLRSMLARPLPAAWDRRFPAEDPAQSPRAAETGERPA